MTYMKHLKDIVDRAKRFGVFFDNRIRHSPVAFPQKFDIILGFFSRIRTSSCFPTSIFAVIVVIIQIVPELRSADPSIDGNGSEISADASLAAKMLRAAEEAQRTGPPKVVVTELTGPLNTKAYVKTLQYLKNGVLLRRYYQSRATLAAASIASTDKDSNATLLDGDHFWSLALKKKVAFCIQYPNEEVLQYCHQAEIRSKNSDPIFDYYNNPGVKHKLERRIINGVQYSLITRTIDDETRRVFFDRKLAATALFNSIIYFTNDNQVFEEYPARFEYLINNLGEITVYRSFSARGKLLVEQTVALHLTLQETPELMAEFFVPEGFTIQFVKNRADEKRMERIFGTP